VRLKIQLPSSRISDRCLLRVLQLLQLDSSVPRSIADSQQAVAHAHKTHERIDALYEALEFDEEAQQAGWRIAHQVSLSRSPRQKATFRTSSIATMETRNCSGICPGKLQWGFRSSMETASSMEN
jgi:hypothetical protein